MEVERPERPWAVREGTTPETCSAVEEYLRRAGVIQLERFAAKDDDELNTGACAGRFSRIVYPDLESLLEAIWKGDADVGRWLDNRIPLDFAMSRGAESAAEREEFLRRMSASLARWRVGERRRQILAGVILSVLALGAAAALLFLAPLRP